MLKKEIERIKEEIAKYGYYAFDENEAIGKAGKFIELFEGSENTEEVEKLKTVDPEKIVIVKYNEIFGDYEIITSDIKKELLFELNDKIKELQD